MNTDVIQDIYVDALLSFGPNCRAADALKRNNLRFFSSPFDWMMKYSLNCVFKTLKNKGKDFFCDFEEKDSSKSSKYRYMVSKSTGMIAMHHFFKYISQDEAYFIFQNTMQKRFNKLDKILSEAKSICIVTSRSLQTEKIISFIKDFLSLYQFEKLYFINIFDDSKEEIKETKFDNIVIYQCHFKDVHPNGADPSQNSKFWKGNMECWDSILKKISLNSDFTDKIKFDKSFNDNKIDFRITLKIFFLKLKYHFLRSIHIVFLRR